MTATRTRRPGASPLTSTGAGGASPAAKRGPDGPCRAASTAAPRALAGRRGRPAPGRRRPGRPARRAGCRAARPAARAPARRWPAPARPAGHRCPRGVEHRLEQLADPAGLGGPGEEEQRDGGRAEQHEGVLGGRLAAPGRGGAGRGDEERLDGGEGAEHGLLLEMGDFGRRRRRVRGRGCEADDEEGDDGEQDEGGQRAGTSGKRTGPAPGGPPRLPAR